MMSSSEETKRSASPKAFKSKTTLNAPSHSRRNTLPLFGPESAKTTALLKNLRAVAGSEQVLPVETELNSIATSEVKAKLTDLQVSTAMSCLSCQITFDNRQEQVQHFKTDWHRYNLKQRLKGSKYVTEMDFMEMADDISSLSGSDSSSEESEEAVDDEGTLVSDRTCSSKRLPAIKARLDGTDSDDDDKIAELVRYRSLVCGLAQSKIYLKSSSGQILSIYRAVICNKKHHIDSTEDLLQLIEKLSEPSTWVVIMMGGGHFAAAVFNNGDVVTHKTFHRYVVRAKAGTAQSQHDKKGGHTQSAGAQIRRHNEAALAQEITELMKMWSEHFRKATRIFIRVGTHNFPYIFNSKEKSHLNKSDQRICAIPFPTRRATFSEVKRVYNELISVHCHESTPNKLSNASSSPTRSRKSPNSNSSKMAPIKSRPKRQEDLEANSASDGDDKVTLDYAYQEDIISTANLQQHERYVPTKQEIEEDRRLERKRRGNVARQQGKTTTIEDRKLLPHRSELYTVCVTTDDSAELSALLDRYHQQISDMTGDYITGINLPVNQQGQTLLHIACQHARPHLVQYLLNAGCDPSIRSGTALHPIFKKYHHLVDGYRLHGNVNISSQFSDDKKMVPYLSTQNRHARNVFRFFMADNPEKYDYEKAQIPGPLSREQWEEKEAKDADRKKEVNKKRKEKLKIKKAEMAKQRGEEEEKKRFLNLSDREKRALAAERRLLEQAKAAGETNAVLNRCHQCATDITGKIPFEYSSNTFCSPACLKAHRFSSKDKS